VPTVKANKNNKMASPGTCILATFIKTPPSGAPFNFRASPNLAAIRLGFGYMAVPGHIHTYIYMDINPFAVAALHKTNRAAEPISRPKLATLQNERII